MMLSSMIDRIFLFINFYEKLINNLFIGVGYQIFSMIVVV